MSQMGMILQLSCIVAFIVGHGNAEDVKISVELSRRDDGEVGASLYIANVTRELFQNTSIFLDFHAFTDKSHTLIGASGYVKDTNRKRAIELTCDATSKDQEIQECQFSKEAEISARDKEIKQLLLQKGKEISARDEEIKELRLKKEKEITVRNEDIKRWSFLCPEKGEDLLIIVSGVYDRYEYEISRENRTQAADFLIIDGHSYTDFSEDMSKLNSYDKQRCNFFVSDDGKVFEGLGWNEYNYYSNGGLGSKSLIIGFIKKDRDSPPSDAAWKTFKQLVRTAVCSNVLYPRFSVIPFYLIYDRFNLSEQSFERNGMTDWVGYKRNLDFLIASDIKGAQPIVSKLEWSGRRPSVYAMIISTPIKYIIVRDIIQRCFLSCRNYLNTSNIFDDFKINFLLAEDGRAYENLGWERSRDRVFQEKKVVVVALLGTFKNYAPNKRIFDAFKGLIEEGLRLGKLSPTFKIVSIETVHPYLSWTMGKYLEEEIRKHPRFSEIV